MIVVNLSTPAQRMIQFAAKNGGFIPLSEARKNNNATNELLDAVLLVHATHEGLDGYKLTSTGRRQGSPPRSMTVDLFGEGTQKILVIEYHYYKDEDKWLPFTVVTEGATLDFNYSKEHGLLYSKAAGGYKASGDTHLLHRHTGKIPEKIWAAPGIVFTRYARSRKEGITTREVAATPYQVHRMGYEVLDRPLKLRGGSNPFKDAQDGEVVWCDLCKDFQLRDHDHPCDHLEWCDRCGCHVYSDGHVREDDPKGPRGEKVVHEGEEMTYVFMSFANIHTGRNIGCCVVESENPVDANEKCKQLGLMPPVCNNARGYALTEDEFKQQGMELNRFYTAEEMARMGFSIAGKKRP